MKKHISLLFVVLLWSALALWAWCKPAQGTSLSERRTLAQFPELSTNSVLSGDFMSDFGDYAVDQFPLRDTFRQVKAVTTYYGFRQSDNNGIYIADGSAVKMEYPLNQSSVDNALTRFNDLYEAYLQDASQIVFAIVPDKGYYLGENTGHLTMDYASLFDTVEKGLSWAEFADITDCLNADSYYRTDTHWRQETLLPAVEKLSDALGIPAEKAFREETLEQDFYGVYYGQAALPLEPDVLRYLTWNGIEDCTVYSQDTGETTAVYDRNKLASKDLYNIFLSGGMALQTIQNPNAATNRELIVFRDSFGSSLVPLLVPQYVSITLIDTRYISPAQIGDYVNFEGKDVLMLYSTLVLNSSSALRK